MAGIDVGSGSKQRAMNQEVNMIPFIDLLFVTIAFLLITAVWVNYSRINANAQYPGANHGGDTPTPTKDLHLHAEPDTFVLTWKQGSTVISERRVPRHAVGADPPRYPDLADAITHEWQTHGEHRDASDRVADRCVLHSDNQEAFREVVAMMDAIYMAKRDMVLADGKRRQVSAFNLAFAAN